MGRPKSYDRDTVIAEAMELFRDHGYANTSTQMLVERLGVNRYSLYAEFRSKQALFDAALERYDREVIEPKFGALEAAEAGLDEIGALLEFYGDAGGGRASGRGCLLCNTAVELGPTDPGGGGFVERYFERLARGFRAALDSAKRRGELGSSVEPGEEAEFLTASVLGLFVMLRAAAPPEHVMRAASAATRHLEGLRSEAST